MEKQKYDALVIGAGNGGLIAALRLAKSGKSKANARKDFCEAIILLHSFLRLIKIVPRCYCIKPKEISIWPSITCFRINNKITRIICFPNSSRSWLM